MTARRLQAACLAIVITVLALLSVAGSSRLSGPVVVAIDWHHGIHREDLVVAGCWLVGMTLCALLARAPRS